jgi:hypothetical protein
MPTVPHGRYEGAEYFRLSFSRENDDRLNVPGKGMMDALRISIGGNEEIGFYFKFRGDPEQVLKMLEVVHEAAKRQLPRGRYDDLRTK